MRTRLSDTTKRAGKQKCQTSYRESVGSRHFLKITKAATTIQCKPDQGVQVQPFSHILEIDFLPREFPEHSSCDQTRRAKDSKAGGQVTRSVEWKCAVDRYQGIGRFEPRTEGRKNKRLLSASPETEDCDGGESAPGEGSSRAHPRKSSGIVGRLWSAEITRHNQDLRFRCLPEPRSVASFGRVYGVRGQRQGEEDGYHADDCYGSDHVFALSNSCRARLV